MTLARSPDQIIRQQRQPTFKFPINNQEQKYEAKIHFTAREVESFDVNFLFNFAKNAAKRTALSKVGGLSGRTALAQFDQDVLNQEKADTAARNAANNGVSTPVSEMQKATGIQFKPGNKGKAILYLPQAIQITDNAQYDNVDLGIIGANAERGLQAGENVLPLLMSELKEAGSSIIDQLTGRAPAKSDLARLAVNRAAQYLPNAGARGAVSATTRVAINPNTRALFKSVPLREFTFTFKMIPTSKEETKQITGLIKFFRENLYPEVIPMGGDNGINAGYKFPNVFDIKLTYPGKEYIGTKILPSYIRNFSATYNASGMGFLEGGDFSEVDITMSFIESGTLHKKLIQDGY